VHRSFLAPPPAPEERAELRSRLGVSPDGFLVLLTSGADGSGGLDRQARALAGAGLGVEIAVICGRNDALRRRIRGLRDHRGVPLTVNGFVDNMADWLRAADVVVTKAGPGTIAEALCCGTPLLLSWYLPGQERGNVDWVIDTGAGRYVPRSPQLIDTVAELSRPGSPGLQAMREAVRRVARPGATASIAALIARMAREGVPAGRP
jgi:1,2-diacylglycerol 3-beta-galactosyltransferase